jgi:nucleoside-diphosphate-sugar epimerase
VDAHLGRGDTVVGVDNLSTGRLQNLSQARLANRFEFIRRDISKSDKLPRADWFYHLASPASPPAYQRDSIGTLLVNSVGTQHVLEAARRCDGGVLIASTSEVYGDPEVHPQREDYWGHVNPIGPRSCYDEGKRFGEALASAYRRTHGLDVRLARVFNTYGPRMDPKDGRVVSNLLIQGLTGQPFTVFGDGYQTRSFCYVDDLIAGMLRLKRVRPTPPTPINLGNPAEFTVNSLVRVVAKVLGVPIRIRRFRLPEDDPRQRRPDISLARRYLRWEPKVVLERGLALTADYFRAQLAR